MHERVLLLLLLLLQPERLDTITVGETWSGHMEGEEVREECPRRRDAVRSRIIWHGWKLAQMKPAGNQATVMLGEDSLPVVVTTLELKYI